MKRTSKSTSRGDRKIPALAVLLSITIVAAVAAFIYADRQKAYQEQYLLRTAEQQVLAQKIAKFALEAAAGNEPSFAALRSSRDRFTQLLGELKNGAPGIALPASPGAMKPALRLVENHWLELRAHVDEILSAQNSIPSVDESVAVINEFIPQLQGASERVLNLLLEAQFSPQQVYLASRQLMLAQRIGNNVNRLLVGGAETVAAIDQFSQDSGQFGAVLQAMLKGDAGLSMTAVTDAEGLRGLREAAILFGSIDEQVTRIVETMPAILPALEATGSLTSSSDQLDRSLRELTAGYRAEGGYE